MFPFLSPLRPPKHVYTVAIYCTCNSFPPAPTTTPGRNSRLGVQLQALKKKEAEETKALEDIVAKVEENLVASTVSCVCVHVH